MAVSVSSLERSGVPIERGVDAAEVIVVIVVDVVERMEFIISVWFCSKAAVCCRVTAWLCIVAVCWRRICCSVVRHSECWVCWEWSVLILSFASASSESVDSSLALVVMES